MKVHKKVYRHDRLNKKFESNWVIYPFGLKISAPINPNIMAAEIPELVTWNIPVNTPIIPCALASCKAPWTRAFPKLVMGMVAPAPAKSTNGSYNPKPSRTAPATTSKLKVWPGVSFATSNNSCPMTQIIPPTTKAQKNIANTMAHPISPFISIATACAIHGIDSFCWKLNGDNKAPVATTKILLYCPFFI